MSERDREWEDWSRERRKLRHQAAMEAAQDPSREERQAAAEWQAAHPSGPRDGEDRRSIRDAFWRRVQELREQEHAKHDGYCGAAHRDGDRLRRCCLPEGHEGPHLQVWHTHHGFARTVLLWDETRWVKDTAEGLAIGYRTHLRRAREQWDLQEDKS